MSLILDGSAGVTFPNSTVQASAGSVIQVVNSVLTSSPSTNSTSFVTTGLTATITPKFSTSKILLLLGAMGSSSSSATGYFTFYRNGSNLAGTAFNLIVTAGNDQSISTSYLDSPATTSATTYALYFKSSSSSNIYLGDGTSPNSFTLLEIAA